MVAPTTPDVRSLHGQLQAARAHEGRARAVIDSMPRVQAQAETDLRGAQTAVERLTAELAAAEMRANEFSGGDAA